jgi:hypothetical protein
MESGYLSILLDDEWVKIRCWFKIKLQLSNEQSCRHDTRKHKQCDMSHNLWQPYWEPVEVKKKTVRCEECYKIAPISFISFHICGQVHFRVIISEPKPNFDRPTFITAVIICCSDQSFKFFVLAT